VVNAMAWQLYARNDLVFSVQEAGWAPEPVWRSAEILTPSKIQSPDRPVHSESLP